MTIRITQILLLALIAQLAFSSIKILSPKGLDEWWQLHPDDHKISWATFGTNPWGRKVMGRLKLAEPINACSYLKSAEEDLDEHYILVARRGDCTFVVKSHFAQLSGAKMLIIVDNVAEDVDTRLMVDDGNLGTTVHIPVGLMTQAGGNRIIQTLQSKDEDDNLIDAVFNFEIPKHDTITYKVWLSSSTSKSFQFANEWKEHWLSHANKIAKMEVHYAHPIRFGANSEDPDCVCNGKYCAPDPDNEGDNTGRDVLLEDLREICIWQKISEEAWWSYMQHYDTFCMVEGNIETCSDQAMTAVGISKSVITNCVKSYFGGKTADTCTSNTYFDEQEKLMRDEAVYIFPDVTIENFAFRGNMVPSRSVFEAICESFNQMPHECLPLFKLGQEGGANHVTASGHGQVIFASVLFLVLFGLIVFTCYRRYLRRVLHKEMVRDVNIAVSQYIAMNDDGNRETRRLADSA